jgi:hypothetical protein
MAKANQSELDSLRSGLSCTLRYVVRQLQAETNVTKCKHVRQRVNKTKIDALFGRLLVYGPIYSASQKLVVSNHEAKTEQREQDYSACFVDPIECVTHSVSLAFL